ncbi:integrase [Paracoccus sp. S-4012]|uniref:DUF6538 domain-containing protein n=1 Tax=Paracoccus sp. S-4012 TaxID=2665648 RepID=UPI0012AFFF9B|nr:DUF6538 domain-containing protein [Paracoccus sp. S-4012]MRX52294.1 integrase [Paracoccus sp. S-4012]
MAKQITLTQRGGDGGNWSMRRRVPARYRSVEPRPFVWVSLKTDSREIGQRKAPEVWANLIEAWEAKLRGEEGDAEARFAAAKELADRRGFRFLEAPAVAQLPIEELLKRVEAATDPKGKIDKMEAEALLGGAKKPVVTVSQAFDLFYVDAKDRVVGMSPDQMRRHRAARARAVKNWIAVKGDMPIHEVTTRDLHDFKAWWLERIVEEDLDRGTANKDFSYLFAMWRAVGQAREIPLSFDTKGLQFKSVEKEATRPPFSTEWLQDALIPGLAKMNTEARAIAFMMVNTGARPSEIAGLSAAGIKLDAKIPHMIVAPEGRKLKSIYADRTVPLVGISLDAARTCPDGFPTYADNPGLSNTINKFMAENGLRETPDHTLYSIRHSFESRMIKADFPERLKADLMGHRLQRERYGEVPLVHMRDWLLKIAL